MKMDFNEIYKRYWDKVYRLCMGYFNRPALAQDLTQDTFVQVWKHLSSFRQQAEVGTWIFRIATNICLRQSQLQQRMPTTELTTEIEEEETVETDHRVHQLYQTISQLPEIDRLLISLYLEEVKQAEIAQITGLSETNVRVRIHRIKSALAQQMKKYETE